MSTAMKNFIESIVLEMEEPETDAVEAAAKSTFNKGMDKANEYRGHPFVLKDALDIYQTVDSRPLYFAGIAYIFVQAAYLQGHSYDKDVLKTSQDWLDKAFEIVPDLAEGLVVQIYLHIHNDNFGPALETIERLEQQGPLSFFARCAQLEYYVRRNNKHRFNELYNKTLSLALTTTRKTYIYNRLAKHLLAFKMFDEAMVAYHEALKFTPRDPWMWHNLSIIHLQKNNIIKAWQCNKNALKLMQFENAFFIRRTIKKVVLYRAFRVGMILLVVLFFVARLLRVLF